MFHNIFLEDRVTFDLTNSPSIGIHNDRSQHKQKKFENNIKSCSLKKEDEVTFLLKRNSLKVC